MSEEPGSRPPPIPPAPGALPVPPPPGTWPAPPALTPVPQPSAAAPPLPPRSTNGFAVASLVLGILWYWGVTSVLALIFGLVARAQIARSRGWQTGGGLAVAGIVLGVVGIVLVFVIIIAAATARFTF